MNKCTKSCTACPYVQEGKYIKIDNTKTWKKSRNMSRESFNIIYLLECQNVSKDMWAQQGPNSNIDWQNTEDTLTTR